MIDSPVSRIKNQRAPVLSAAVLVHSETAPFDGDECKWGRLGMTWNGALIEFGHMKWNRESKYIYYCLQLICHNNAAMVFDFFIQSYNMAIISSA